MQKISDLITLEIQNSFKQGAKITILKREYKLTDRQIKKVLAKDLRPRAAQQIETSKANKKAKSFKDRNPHLYPDGKELKELVIKIFGERCLACGTNQNIVADHIKPRYLGGDNSIENLQPLCVKCNYVKRLKIIDYRL